MFILKMEEPLNNILLPLKEKSVLGIPGTDFFILAESIVRTNE